MRIINFNIVGVCEVCGGTDSNIGEADLAGKSIEGCIVPIRFTIINGNDERIIIIHEMNYELNKAFITIEHNSDKVMLAEDNPDAYTDGWDLWGDIRFLLEECQLMMGNIN